MLQQCLESPMSAQSLEARAPGAWHASDTQFLEPSAIPGSPPLAHPGPIAEAAEPHVYHNNLAERVRGTGARRGPTPDQGTKGLHVRRCNILGVARLHVHVHVRHHAHAMLPHAGSATMQLAAGLTARRLKHACTATQHHQRRKAARNVWTKPLRYAEFVLKTPQLIGADPLQAMEHPDVAYEQVGTGAGVPQNGLKCSAPMTWLHTRGMVMSARRVGHPSMQACGVSYACSAASPPHRPWLADAAAKLIRARAGVRGGAQMRVAGGTGLWPPPDAF